MSIEKQVFPDAASVGRATATKIAALAVESVAARGQFTIALSGGSTPKQAYALLAAQPLVERMPWAGTKIYFGDERHVRPDHSDSNYRMAYEAMLKTAPIPGENVFPIPTDDPDLARCAEHYEKLLRMNFLPASVAVPDASADFPVFDLILLGIGPDGHTASLFPGTPAPLERQRWVTWSDPLQGNPNIKPAVKRITLTAPVIWNARQVFVLATGAEKAPVLAKIFSEIEPPNPPVSRLLTQCRGLVTFLMDQAAQS